MAALALKTHRRFNGRNGLLEVDQAHTVRKHTLWVNLKESTEITTWAQFTVMHPARPRKINIISRTISQTT
jgi:hypothetical protein